MLGNDEVTISRRIRKSCRFIVCYISFWYWVLHTCVTWTDASIFIQSRYVRNIFYLYKFEYYFKSIFCSNVELIEPQQTALAKLCSYCIYASVELQQNSIVKNEVHKTTNNMDIVRWCLFWLLNY